MQNVISLAEEIIEDTGYILLPELFKPKETNAVNASLTLE